MDNAIEYRIVLHEEGIYPILRTEKTDAEHFYRVMLFEHDPADLKQMVMHGFHRKYTFYEYKGVTIGMIIERRKDNEKNDTGNF